MPRKTPGTGIPFLSKTASILRQCAGERLAERISRRFASLFAQFRGIRLGPRRGAVKGIRKYQINCEQLR
jgi:hypothetical protein